MEEKVKEGPILRSFKRDSLLSAKTFVGSNAIPDEEAVLLSKHSFGVRNTGTALKISIIAIVVILAGLFIFYVPSILNKNKENIIVTSIPYTEFFVPEYTYAVQAPLINENNTDMKDSFAREAFIFKDGITQLVPTTNKVALSSLEFLNVFSERLGTNLNSFIKPHMFYGVVGKNNGKYIKRFLILQYTDFGTAQSGMLKAERTLYTDIFDIFGLPDIFATDNKIDIREFVDGNSVKTPVRVLYDNKKNPVLVYGFVNNFIVIAEDIDTFSTIRDRIWAVQ